MVIVSAMACAISTMDKVGAEEIIDIITESLGGRDMDIDMVIGIGIMVIDGDMAEADAICTEAKQ